MLEKINERLKNSRGQSMLEYILIVVFVVVVGIVVWRAFGDAIKQMVSGSTSVITEQVNDATKDVVKGNMIKPEQNTGD